ncbi:hypothetical protein ALP64_204863 [Pseudomonas syringae pv. actinidiae]|nr:hypothetical protein ALP64_204863 [Pseudomonas syringae pv. actinidiae]
MRIANSYNGDSISSCNPIHHDKMGKVSTLRVVNNADNYRSSITGVSSQISNISTPKSTGRNAFRSHQACNISSVNPTVRRRNPLDKRSYINFLAQRIQDHTARVVSASRHGPLVHDQTITISRNRIIKQRIFGSCASKLTSSCRSFCTRTSLYCTSSSSDPAPTGQRLRGTQPTHKSKRAEDHVTRSVPGVSI